MDFNWIMWLWKTGGSGGGGCPSLMQVDGGYIVQGKKLSAEAKQQIHDIGAQNDSGLAADEDAVFVPNDVLDALRK